MRIRLALFWWYVFARLLEYDPLTGKLAHDRALIGMGKGNIKTEAFGEFGVTELVGPIAPIRSPRVILSAASYDQSVELFNAAKLSIVGDPDNGRPGPLAPYFREGDQILEDRILLPDGVGRIERIAAVGGTSDGGKPTAHLGDEVHEWESERARRVYTVQGKSLRKRKVIRRTPPELGLPPGVFLHGGIQAGLTTAGADHDSLLGELYDHGVAVAKGEVEDPGFLFLWWEADERWDLEDPAQRLQAELEGNPAAGGSLPIENIEASFRDVTVPRSEYVRYNLNRWPDNETRWMPPPVWDATEGVVTLDPKQPVYVAVLVAHNHRTAAIAAAQRQGDHVAVRLSRHPETPLPFGEYLGVAELEAELEGLRKSHPARVLVPKRLRPGAPEKLLPAAGPEIAYTGAFFEGSAQRLRATGAAMVDIPTSPERLAPAAETLLGLATKGLLIHEADPALAIQVGDVVARETTTGWALAARAGKEIVGATAVIVAVHRAMTAPRPPAAPSGGFGSFR
jgi:phage terminase large subunit-like protein